MLVPDTMRLGQLIYEINKKMIARQNNNLVSLGVTVQQALVIAYLDKSKDKKVTQRMIEIVRLSRFWLRCVNLAWKPSHGRRFMTEEIAGFQTSPKAQVQAAFEEIARRSMHDLSFLHPSMPVYVSDFTLFEGQWTGCVITPWMLSAVIFPGPDQLWPLRKVSEKIGLQLPYGTMTFTVGELDGVSQYLSCSLMSPLSHSMSIEEGQRLTDDCARMILSLPVTNPDVPHAGRRALLFGRRSGENA